MFFLAELPTLGVCFPSVATILIENEKIVIMNELKIGDRVKTGKINEYQI